MGQGLGAKFFKLVPFYKLSMFPGFIILDAHQYFITCKSNSLLRPFPRCNEDPVCRNPRGFRITKYMSVFELKVLVTVNLKSTLQTSKLTHLVCSALDREIIIHYNFICLNWSLELLATVRLSINQSCEGTSSSLNNSILTRRLLKLFL